MPRRRKGPPPVTIATQVPPDHAEAIDRLCATTELSRAKVVQLMVKACLASPALLLDALVGATHRAVTGKNKPG